MSNLLSSLIARATETAVTLQPRPHALFETVGPVAQPPQTLEDLKMAESAPAPIQPLAPAEPRHQPDMSTRPKPKPIAPKWPAGEHARASQLPTRPQISVAATSPPDQGAVPSPNPTPVPDHALPGQPVVVKTYLVAERPILQPQIQPVAPLETAVSPRPDVAMPVLKSGQREQSAPTQPARLAAPPVPPMPKIETPAAKLAPPIIQTTIIAQMAGAKAVPQQPEAIVPTQAIPHIPPEQKRPLSATISQEPVIQVHIGRIEVRATPQETAPPPKKQEPLPVMGLDDYLRQRSARNEQRRHGQGGKA